MDWLEEVLIQCPQCGEEFAIQIETAVDGTVEMIEDCAVCCRPALVLITTRGGMLVSSTVEAA
jgi:phage terminase large subunit GpA-like protein